MLLLVILSRWVCFSPSTMVSFHHHCCWLLFYFFIFGFLISHECDHSFGSLLTSKLLSWAIILSPYTPPLGSLLVDSFSAVATTSPMATDIAATPHLYPLFLMLEGHPSKNFQDRYTMVREWKAIKKVQPSSRSGSGLPPGRGYRSAPEVEKSVSGALTGPVVVDTLLIVIFWGFSAIPPHIWVQPLLWVAAFLLNYLYTLCSIFIVFVSEINMGRNHPKSDGIQAQFNNLHKLLG